MLDVKRWLWRSAMAGGLATAMAVNVMPAQAQFFGGWGYRGFGGPVEMDDEPVYAVPRYRPGLLAPMEVREILFDQGYRILGPLQPNGRVYVANVHDRRGARYRVVIDGRSGAIVQRMASVPAPPLPDDDWRDERIAPRVVPGVRPDGTPRVERPARTAVRPDVQTPVQERPAVSPDRPRPVAPSAAKPAPAREKPVAARPDVPKPDVLNPASAAPATAKPTLPPVGPQETTGAPAVPEAPVAAAPRVVYPGGPAGDAGPKPTPDVPVAPLDAPPAAAVRPTPDVPVAPLE